MEDVVLHYQPGSAAGLSSLLERTEKLLEPFPCRIPPVFTRWYPSSTDHHLPIRPAKPAPVITCSDDFFFSDSRTHTPQIQPQKPEVDGPPAETSPENPQEPKDVACISETPNYLFPEREVPRLHTEKHKDVFPVTESPVWRSLNRSVQSSTLPTCNANIQRERAEIWVFCDVVHSEQVGCLLKDELQLTGRIRLSVHRLDNIFSM
ncbi:hypothetical protein F7725_013331 [Dissostichus mawsoni]|uniref:Shieldin complex subunit 3 n=1 Tax=Dissostichus mawsoni TaxID=36200 RepID=A0A7J5YS78_DISMA|nr:hypothetical protein F7725_013331 [Dissostichus mawsoni]